MVKVKSKKVKSKQISTNKPEEKNDLITIVLLCDLPGYRMKSYGPTSLIKIDEKYLIDIQINAIKKCFSNYEIIICLGFESDKIAKYLRSKYKNLNIRLVENQIYNHCNSCEGIRLGINNTFNDKILIVDGNLIFNHKILSLTDTKQSCAITEKYPSENLEIGININGSNNAQHFSFGAYKTWSEIFFLYGNEQIDLLRKFLNHADSKKKFSFEAINEIIKNEHKILCIENKIPIYKINNIKTYHSIRTNHEVFNI
jgi:hypothetical protein